MWKTIFRYLLSATMVAAGALHFVSPDKYVKIVPEWLPAPRILVFVSGFFEIAGGLGLCAGENAPGGGIGPDCALCGCVSGERQHGESTKSTRTTRGYFGGGCRSRVFSSPGRTGLRGPIRKTQKK